MSGRPPTVRTDEFKDAICAAYLAGQPIVYVAGSHGVAEKTARRILTDRGIPLRTRP